jgi:Ulp1 protease family, C-terminal catalytic domain
LEKECKITKWPLFDVVITDHSWVMIRSVIEGFNDHMTLALYIEILYASLGSEAPENIKKKVEKMTLVFICCAHFLKIVVNLIKDKVTPKNNGKTLKDLIKKCFALMIECTEYEKLKIIFEKFALITCSPIINENVIATLCDVEENNFQTSEMAQLILEDDETIFEKPNIETDSFFEVAGKPMYKQSKFYYVFQEILSGVIGKIDNNMTGEPNPYYIEGTFMEHVTKQYMPYVVLWTSIITGKRFSNSVGENHFRDIKHLKFTERNLEPTVFIRKQRDNIKSALTKIQLTNKYDENPILKTPVHKNTANKATASRTKTTPKSGSGRSKRTPMFDSEKSNKSNFSIDDPCSKSLSEKWGARTTKKRQTAFTSPFLKDLSTPKKSKISSKRKLIKEKFQPTLKAIIEAGNTEEMINIEDKIGSANPVMKIENLEEFGIEPIQKKPKIEVTDDKGNNSDNTKENVENVFHLNYKAAMNNGLFENPNYYMKPSCKEYKIGKYDVNTKRKMVLSYRDYMTMRGTDWLSGELVDILMKLREQQTSSIYEPFFYIDHLITKKINEKFTKYDKEFTNYDKEILRSSLDHPFIVLSYCCGRHWYLMIADMTKKEFIIINPFKPYKLQEKKSAWFEYFKKYLNLNDDKTWKLTAISETDYILPIQTDGYSCGILIVLYIDIIFGKMKIYEGDVQEVRMLYQLQLLHASLPVKNVAKI